MVGVIGWFWCWCEIGKVVDGSGGVGWIMARHMGQVGVWWEDSLEDSHRVKHAVWKEWVHGVVING